MTRRLIAVGAAAATVAATGATLATGSGRGLIWDDDHYAQPGSLDDGKELLPQAKISLADAVAAARLARAGAVGQVDLERNGATVVYMVDVGDREVRVDAADGSVVAIDPRD